ncbi:MAG: hypothetical protein WD342_17560 [Verrucomicrobiales bacterium]
MLNAKAAKSGGTRATIERMIALPERIEALHAEYDAVKGRL